MHDDLNIDVLERLDGMAIDQVESLLKTTLNNDDRFKSWKYDSDMSRFSTKVRYEIAQGLLGYGDVVDGVIQSIMLTPPIKPDDRQWASMSPITDFDVIGSDKYLDDNDIQDLLRLIRYEVYYKPLIRPQSHPEYLDTDHLDLDLVSNYRWLSDDPTYLTQLHNQMIIMMDRLAAHGIGNNESLFLIEYALETDYNPDDIRRLFELIPDNDQ